MTNEDLKDWVECQGCIFEPIDGINVTGWSLKVINPKNRKFTYLSGPFDGKRVPAWVVRDACRELGIETPDECKKSN